MITTGIVVSPFVQSLFIKYERISKHVFLTIFFLLMIYVYTSNKAENSALPCAHELSDRNCMNVVIASGNWSKRTPIMRYL